jgi:hypothetical protein
VKAADLATGHSFSTDPLYAVLSGTSMAAPSNAGAAALVIDGYHRATGADPAYYVVKAALTNTAHSGAFEGPVTGLLSSIRATRLGEDPATAFPIRNQEWVGVTGEGAGRIDVPSAYLASTFGVVAYTPADRVDGALTTHALQPSWSLDDLAPGESAAQTFVVRGGPKLPGNRSVSWAFEPDPAVEGVGSIPASWVSVPPLTVARPGAETTTQAQLLVPADAAPGIYAGTIVGAVTIGNSVVEHIRLPVQVFVTLPATSSIEAPIFATGPTDYSAVGLESPLGGIATDWVMYPVRLPADTSQVRLAVHDPAGKAHMDVFAFDGTGNEIDSSVSPYLEQAVPQDLLLAPTGPDNPNEVVLLDGSDFTEVTTPTTIWVVVSDTVPSGPGFETFHLDVTTTTAAPAAPAPPGDGGIALPPLPVAAASGSASAPDARPSAELGGTQAIAGRGRGGSGPEPIALVALALDVAVLVAIGRRLRRRAVS